MYPASARPSFAVRFAVPWTDDAVAPAVFAFRQNKVDIRVVDNPFYTCRPNSGSKRCFLERSALWNREEVSAMLIIDWNAALRSPEPSSPRQIPDTYMYKKSTSSITPPCSLFTGLQVEMVGCRCVGSPQQCSRR